MKKLKACDFYLLYNTITDKVYIGSTTWGIGKRLSCHKSHAITGTALINIAIREYGFENFGYIILGTLFEYTTKERWDKENYYINLYNSRDPNFGYNVSPAGSISGKYLKDLALLKRKRVLCINTGIVYASATIASEETDINRSNICNCCRGKSSVKHAGIFNGVQGSWKYVD